MPETIVETVTIGPGLLKLKHADDPTIAAEVRLMSCTVAWSESVTRTEGRKLLGGGRTKSKSTSVFTATLAGKFVQDWEDEDGVVAFTWLQRGEPVDFTYVPNEDVDRAVQGVTYPIPLDVGGDVDVDGPEADFTWRTEDDSVVLGAYDPFGGIVTPDF